MKFTLYENITPTPKLPHIMCDFIFEMYIVGDEEIKARVNFQPLDIIRLVFFLHKQTIQESIESSCLFFDDS